ncbi:MAG: hypothetical protein JJT99_07640 [Rhodobacteraceae bacterium]|nr:hypothetical protein [Paracoccaceae bacterium]
MEISLHLGAHLTDEGRLLRCLSANRKLLAQQGIAVPDLAQFRDLLLAMAGTTDPAELDPEADQILLASADIPDTARRAVFSDPKLLSWKGGAVRIDQFYPNAPGRMATLRRALGANQVELFLAIRNPASFIPALLHGMKPGKAKSVLSKLKPQELRWSRLIADLQDAWPEARLTLWCDEDTPFIWHQILAHVSGHKEGTQLAQSYDWFDEVMIDGGAQKLEAYLSSVPPVDEAHRQRVIAAFLDKFCDPEKIDVDVSSAGWDAEMVDLLSELYDADLAAIADMQAVTLIQP